MVNLAKLYAGPLGDKDKAAEFNTKARELAPAVGNTNSAEQVSSP